MSKIRVAFNGLQKQKVSETLKATGENNDY